MKIVTKIGGGRIQHAAAYDQKTGAIKLFCNSLRYPNYFAFISDPRKPTLHNVDCVKCLKNIALWEAK